MSWRKFSATVAGILLFLAAGCGQPGADSGEEILVLCGGSMRAALEEIIGQYKEVEPDVNVLATYGGSGELCAQIQNTGRGDLYLCHDPFMPWAHDQGLIDEWKTVGGLDVVLIVPKGNPENIEALEDLAEPGVRVGIGNQTYSTSGQIVKHLFRELDYGDQILENVRVETKGHQQRCNDVVMGTLDAALVWNAVAHLYKDRVEIMPVPTEKLDAITTATYDKLDLSKTKVTMGIIAGSAERPAVQDFYEFATSRGLLVFREKGFLPPDRVK